MTRPTVIQDSDWGSDETALRRERPDEPLKPEESALIDKLQEEVMSQESAEGRPPPKRLRTAEWTVLAIIAPLVLLGVAAWALSRGVDSRMILAGLVLVIAVIGATSPVWGAGLLRGREERAARRQAKSEVHTGHR